MHILLFLTIYFQVLKKRNKGKRIASAGNRTRVNCLEGSYAHHYTTDALTGGRPQWAIPYGTCAHTHTRQQMKRENIKSAVTRIRTWVTAATTQGPNH